MQEPKNIVGEIASLTFDLAYEPVKAFGHAISERKQEIIAEAEASGKDVSQIISEGLLEGFQELDDSPVGQIIALALYEISTAAFTVASTSIDVLSERLEKAIDTVLSQETPGNDTQNILSAHMADAKIFNARDISDSRTELEISGRQDRGIER